MTLTRRAFLFGSAAVAVVITLPAAASKAKIEKGFVRGVAFFDRALTDEELVAITNDEPFYAQTSKGLYIHGRGHPEWVPDEVRAQIAAGRFWHGNIALQHGEVDFTLPWSDDDLAALSA